MAGKHITEHSFSIPRGGHKSDSTEPNVRQTAEICPAPGWNGRPQLSSGNNFMKN